MKTRFLFFGLYLMHLSTTAQNETRNWCFSYGQHIYFDTSSVQILPNCSITGEPASCISDSSGNLLFYTNGETVWNKLNNVIQNGSGLHGSFSATQCLIVKQPLSDSLYYVFYADGWGGSSGANYAIVDISQNDGLGAVISKNNLLFTPSSEKFSAIKNTNDIDIWVMTRTVNPPVFKAYSLTGSGLNTTPVISYDATSENTGIGQMKFSHDGTMLALGITDMSQYELLYFDASTGLLSNPKLSNVFPFFGGGVTYGVEFSPNDNILYGALTLPPVLLKFDLTSGGNLLLNYTVIDTSSSSTLGSLQLAIDGNIYLGRNDSRYLGVIHNPNSWTLSNYVDDGLALNNTTSRTLPNFEQSLLRKEKPSIKHPPMQENFLIYPNPFEQDININGSYEILEVTVNDLFGRTVFSKQFSKSDMSKVELNYLPSGLYLISILSNHQRVSKLIQKK